MWKDIFDLLGTRDLLILRRTCKWIQSLVQQYWEQTFNISRLLRPFLMLEDIDSFRQLLHKTGGIIGGSSALQFLDRRAFNTLSDLDIYVQYEKTPQVKEWLRAHGLRETRSSSHSILDVNVRRKEQTWWGIITGPAKLKMLSISRFQVELVLSN